MIDNLKKYWFLYSVVLAFATWLITINSKIFDSPEQKVEVLSAVKSMPSAADRAVEVANDNHAIEIRQMRYENQFSADSIKVIKEDVKDSLTMDAFKRFTVQIEKMNEKIDNIHN